MSKLMYLFPFFAAIMATSCKTSRDTTACIDPAKVDPNAVCTMQYDPVCGCDQKTYSNSCMAEKSGVTSYTKGACPDATANNN